MGSGVCRPSPGLRLDSSLLKGLWSIHTVGNVLLKQNEN